MVNETAGKGDRDSPPSSDCIFYLDLMSHEVLNFNQAVLGYLELIQNDPEMSDEIKRYLVSAINQIRNSSQLIDDVKKIAHLGIMDESMFELFDLKKIVNEGIEELKFQNPGRKLRINFKDADNRIMVKSTDALKDVVNHLLTNAVKYDSSDEVIIDVSIEHPPEAPGYVDLNVEDRGTGVPDQMKKALTAEFESDEKTKVVRGMGLLLVRAAAKRFGGKLIISDRVPGNQTKGAKMTVRLPEARGR